MLFFCILFVCFCLFFNNRFLAKKAILSKFTTIEKQLCHNNSNNNIIIPTNYCFYWFVCFTVYIFIFNMHWWNKPIGTPAQFSSYASVAASNAALQNNHQKASFQMRAVKPKVSSHIPNAFKYIFFEFFFFLKFFYYFNHMLKIVLQIQRQLRQIQQNGHHHYTLMLKELLQLVFFYKNRFFFFFVVNFFCFSNFCFVFILNLI